MTINASHQNNGSTTPPPCSHCGQAQIQVTNSFGVIIWRCREGHCNLLEAQAVIRITQAVRGFWGIGR